MEKKKSGTPIAVPLLGFLLICLLWGVVVKRLDDERRVVTNQTFNYARLLAAALNEHTVKALHQIDQIARLIKFSYETNPQHFSLKNLVARGIIHNDALVQVAIVNSRGLLIDSSFAIDKKPIHLSDREYFRIHIPQDIGNLYVSKLVLGRISNKWTLQFSRRLNMANGCFAGVVVISVSPTYFTNDFYNGAVFDNGDMIAILAKDGTVLSRRASVNENLASAKNIDLTQTGAYRQLRHAIGIGVDPLDKLQRIFAFQPVSGFPIDVIVGLSERTALDSYRHTRTIYLMMTALTSLAVVGFVVVISNLIGRLSDRERAMTRLAQFDPLTGLPNRWRMVSLLRNKLSAPHSVGRVAVLSLGLDNFKVVNDTLGHYEGDEILVSVARRLSRVAAQFNQIESITIGRIAGDGYMVIAQGNHIDKTVPLLAQNLGHAIAEPAFERRGVRFNLKASIGIALHTMAHEGESDLLKKCDLAMYSAKESSRGQYEIYNPQLSLESERLIEWDQMLRDAISGQQFHLKYQPKIDLKTHNVIGFEAILCWHHPRHGKISPNQFMPIAETLGWVVSIGEFVIESVSQQLAVWRTMGKIPLNIAINISSLHFWRGDLLVTMERCAAEHQVNANWIEIELSETTTINHPELAEQKMRKLKAYGFRIALDNFGIGHSSLAYLHCFPIDTLKINHLFMQSLLRNEKGRKLIIAVIRLAHSLKLNMVMQGIETQAQVDWLIHLCRFCKVNVQGDYFSKPLAAAAVNHFIEQFNQSK